VETSVKLLDSQMVIDDSKEEPVEVRKQEP
jgi:hypothetical protein